ncbi:MAG: hypothetical protein LBP59_10270 [Planctomycetaceae bacterium]|jgi:hypothetical protein|nr:hypothetical protein [Planctomycetaceae bacterium]
MFQIIRSGVLLSVLIFLPLMAVFWNMIPKDIFQNNKKTNSVAQIPRNNLTIPESAEQITSTKQQSKNNFNNNKEPESVWLTSSIPLNADPLRSNSLSADSKFDQNNLNGSSSNQYSTMPPLNHSPRESDLVNFTPMTALATNPATQSSSNSTAADVNRNNILTGGQRDFSEIVRELQQLGATYYCLEKWGNQGELFRFRCYVNPNGAAAIDNNQQNNNNKYQKFFQHIDNDQIRVMEHVINEIKKWKGIN